MLVQIILAQLHCAITCTNFYLLSDIFLPYFFSNQNPSYSGSAAVKSSNKNEMLLNRNTYSLGVKSNVFLVDSFTDDKSSIKTGTSQFSSVSGLSGWRWELAYLYTDCMTSICMNGQTSIIQKTALLGSEANRKVTIYGKRNAMSREGLGLLDLLKLRFTLEQGACLFLYYFLKVDAVQNF